MPQRRPQAADAFVRSFRDSAPYIHAHRGRTCVVQVGGAVAETPRLASLVQDIALLHALGLKLVLVYGIRPQIDHRLRERGQAPRFHGGLRITDDDALAAALEAAGHTGMRIQALLSMGLVNTPMAGARIRVASGNLVTARPLGVRDGIDHCHTGEVRRIDTDALRRRLDDDCLVLLPPIGHSPTGEIFNLSAEELAAETAMALRADKLVFMIEGPGLRDGRRRPLRQLDLAEAERLLGSRRRLDDALRRHLRQAVAASRRGVARTHLVDWQDDGALLRELFTRDGAGTLITAETYEGLRPAAIEDVGGILRLIRPLEEAGTLVRRSRERLEMEIDRFLVIERDGMVVGCAALYPYPAEGLAELACLAVDPAYQKAGRGHHLLQAAERRARELGIRALFVLTTRAAHWFRERGFVAGQLQKLPIRRRELYNYRRNSKVFFKTL